MAPGTSDSRTQVKLVATVVLGAGLLAGTMIWQSERRDIGIRRVQLTQEVSSYAEAIRRDVDRALSATYPLAVQIRRNNGQLPDFEKLANEMLPYYKGASGLVLAPGGVISQVVPAGNEKAIGLDLLKDPRRDREAILARDSGQLTMAGPFEMLQGGVAAIGRLPVYLGNPGDDSRFWGLVTVQIRFPDVLEGANLAQLADNGNNYELWRTHPDTGQRHVFAQAGQNLTDPVDIEISVPNARWHLSASPREGWIDWERLTGKFLRALVFVGLAGWISSLLWRQRRSREELECRVQTATRELQHSVIEAERLRDRFGSYFEHAPNGIFVADPNGCYTDVNPACCELLGYSRDELCGGMSILDLAPTHSGMTHRALFGEMQKAGGGDVEIELRRKDGYLLQVALRASVLKNGYMIGFASDITESRVVQNSLQLLATRLSRMAGQEFFEAVCHFISEQFALEHVFVGLLDNTGRSVQVAAGWSQHAPMAPFSYDLLHTPCEDVVKDSKAIFACAVQSLFPQDALLQAMGIEGYAGASLFDKERRPLGILVGLRKTPIAKPALLEKIFDLFIERLSAEILRSRAEEAAHLLSRQVRTVINGIPAGVAVADLDSGHLSFANETFAAMLGYSAEQIATMHPADIHPAELAPEVERQFNRLVSREITMIDDVPILRADGSTFPAEIRAQFGELDGRRSLFGVFTDISARKLADTRMREALVVFNTSSQGIMTTDAAGLITAINPAFSEITGYAADEVVGQKPSIFSSGRHDAAFYAEMWRALGNEGYWQGEIWNRRRNREIYPQWLTISTVRNPEGAVIGHVSMFSDITERKQQEEAIWRQANFDALTGLANRNLFTDRLERAMAQARRRGTKVGLAFLDLDGFKWINDTLGHDVGDSLLVEVGRRLRVNLRDQDTAARLGGDEFTLIIQDLANSEDMLSVCEKLVGILRQPYELAGSSHQITGSVGVTVFPDDGEDVQNLLKNADIAMYKAKQGGKNRYQFYARHMQIDAHARMQMEADLRKAISDQQLRLHYQPIVDADSGELVGAEALLRWQHPAKGLVSPLEFIPVAEDSGLIVPIGAWAMREAARQWAAWARRGLPALRLSVNVSSVQFGEAEFSRFIVDVLREYDVAPGYLVLEITESVLMDSSPAAEARLREIKELGISYALDDFGTGFSSLSYLKRFPVDIVKIDRSFIKDCPEDRNDTHLVEAIVNMAHSLDLRVTAEGVETREQFEFLSDLGCDYIQGYLAGKPVPATEFESLMEMRQLILPSDGARFEESRFLAALRQDEMNVDAWMERLLADDPRDLGRYNEQRDWTYEGLDLRHAVQAHLDWRRRLDRFISGGSDSSALGVAEARSHERCQLGQWIRQYEHNDDPCFERLDLVHRDFHRLAGQIVDDHLAGHRSLARRALTGSTFRKASRDVVVAMVECYRTRIRRDG